MKWLIAYPQILLTSSPCLGPASLIHPLPQTTPTTTQTSPPLSLPATSTPLSVHKLNCLCRHRYFKRYPKIEPKGYQDFDEWRASAVQEFINRTMAPSKSRKVAIVGSRSVGKSCSSPFSSLALCPHSSLPVLLSPIALSLGANCVPIHLHLGGEYRQRFHMPAISACTYVCAICACV